MSTTIGSVGVGVRDAFERGDPVGVGQVEVQQHAVRAGDATVRVRHRPSTVPTRRRCRRPRRRSALRPAARRRGRPRRAAPTADARPLCGPTPGPAQAWVCGSSGARMGDHVLYVTSPGRATLCFSDNASDNTQGPFGLPHSGPPASDRARDVSYRGWMSTAADSDRVADLARPGRGRPRPEDRSRSPSSSAPATTPGCPGCTSPRASAASGFRAACRPSPTGSCRARAARCRSGSTRWATGWRRRPCASTRRPTT